MSKSKINDIAVIIRSADERTEDFCHYLISQQLPEDRIVLIKEKPFSTALARSFEIGLEFGLPWTLCIDADVLISNNAIADYLTEMEKYDETTFGLSGFLLDKFYGTRKRRGLHLYRTSLLDKALKLLDDAKDDLRPETAVKLLMEAKGHKWGIAWGLYGVHDYEQYYVDIFRKMATRAQKSSQDYSKLLKRAKLFAKDDNDFHVMEWGLRFGHSLTSGEALLHADQWAELARNLLLCNGIEEKEDLFPDEIEANFIQSILNRNGIVSEKQKRTVKLNGADNTKYTVWKLGQLLLRTGSYLQRRALK